MANLFNLAANLMSMRTCGTVIVTLLMILTRVQGQVIISEIMYNPPEPGQDTLEYVEVYNPGSTAVNLEGWYFSAGPVFSFPDFVLAPGAFAIICKNSNYFEQIFGPLPTFQWTSGALSNNGTTITLQNPGGDWVTSVTYSNSPPWPGGQANGNGASINLCDPAGPQDDPTNWQSSRTATGIYHYGQEILANPLENAQCQFASEFGLVLTGVFDAQPSNVGARGIEIYARKDIPDLSIYGVGSANNGGGSNGVEFGFPAMAVDSGTFLYVAADSALFRDFYGMDADFVHVSMNINGDDAIELFEFDEVIDVFGDIATDGTGQPWEYLDGWAYRLDGTGPDGNAFKLAHWYFSGIGGLSGSPDNPSSPKPFPIGTWLEAVQGLTAHDDFYTIPPDEESFLDVLSNDLLPNGFHTFEFVSLPGNASANFQNDGIQYQPIIGYCGLDSLQYRLCDSMTCDSAWVWIQVECQPVYPVYPIALVRTVGPDGVVDSLGISCQLEGVVYGVNLRPGGLQFVLIDDQQTGITVFSQDDKGYSVLEGDRIVVRGTIAQFNGLAQIQPDEIEWLAGGQTLLAPLVVDSLGEFTESQLIRVENVKIVDPMEWTNTGPGFNVRVENGSGEFVMRIDNDVNVYGSTPPTGSFHLTGLGTQFSSDAPYLDGYQIMPRYLADIDLIQSTFPDPTTTGELKIWPNPSRGMVQLSSNHSDAEFRLTDTWGRMVTLTKVFPVSEGVWHLDLSHLSPGVYHLTSLSKEGRMVTARLVRIP